MMTWLQVLVLAVVEGITEFLPISSTGHMVLAAKLLSIPQTDFVKSFEIAIQLGAILAVVWEMRAALKSIRTLQVLAAAFLPTGILGVVVYKPMKEYLLGNVWVTIAALAVGGGFMIGYELRNRPENKNPNGKGMTIEEMGFVRAMLIGVVQTVSMIPGVSRAMATIFGGMGAGLARAEAVRFSFLLAIPTMAAATGWDLVKSGVDFGPQEWMNLTAGSGVAFGVAWATVKWLLSYVRQNDFKMFGVYRILLAGVFWWMLTTY